MALYVYLRNRKQRVDRIFRDRKNPLDFFNDEEIRLRYRLDREMIHRLCELLNDDLSRPTKRSQSLSVSLQVMTALRYYATGNFFCPCVAIFMGYRRCLLQDAFKVSQTPCANISRHI